MEAIGTLAGGIAHDFNNILTVFSAYGTLLKLGLDEKDRLWSYADNIEKEVQKAAGLTHRLLAFCRKQVINPKAVKLNEIVANLKKILALLITEEIVLQVHLEPADPVIMADSGQLDHVLVNLVTNARDAMPRGGSLTITTGIVADDHRFKALQGDCGGYAFISVTDTGVGMTEEIKERIFDPFFTTKEVGKGTGLGLSMAYGIMQQHNGIVEVDSEPGKGTSFRLYLPLNEQFIAERKTTDTMPLLRRSSATILVAEDDTAVMVALKRILQDNGYTVIDATDGEDAIRKFIEHKDRIQLALLDVIMPRKNGRQVYDEIIKIKPNIKTVFVSGYTNDMISSRGVLEEGFQLITKPVRVDELLQKLKEILEGSEA